MNRDTDVFPSIKKTGVQGSNFVENVHSAEFATREPVSESVPNKNSWFMFEPGLQKLKLICAHDEF